MGNCIEIKAFSLSQHGKVITICTILKVGVRPLANGFPGLCNLGRKA